MCPTIKFENPCFLVGISANLRPRVGGARLKMEHDALFSAMPDFDTGD
jgi:hypothetical protein